MKRIIAALLAGLCLFTLVGCSAGSKADSAAPKDYSQIIHDARTDEDNEYDMIFTKGEDGKFTADDYAALVAAMFDGTVTVSNDITAMPAVTNVTVEDFGNLK